MGKQIQEKPQVQAARRSRKWPWITGGILVLILVLLLLIPVILSPGGFTQWIQGRISDSTGGQANIGDLSVGWLKGVQVADFKFRAPNGWAEVDIDRITARPSYSSLLGGTLAVGSAVLDQPHIAVDLRERPPSTEAGPSMDMNDLSRIRDLVVRDGSVQLTSMTGQTMRISDLDSQVSMRPPGRTSRFDVSLAVAQAQGPAEVRASGQVTPDRKTGWSLRGTTGDVTVEVNALELDSIAPLLDVAGIDVEARGQLTGNITSVIQDGQIENISADIRGRNVDITGPALKGDRLQTAQLNIQAELAQAQDVIDVDQLSVQTDWASVSAAGTFPKNARTLAQLTESGADVTGKFDVNLAALLSQMPNTLGVREGMEITGGRATGNIDTVTKAGRPTIVAKAQVVGLAGVVDDKELNLSQPMQATARLSGSEQGAQLDGLSVSTSFAKINASGNFKQIKYDGQVNLAALQSELGAFVNLPYELAGQVTSAGQVSVGEKITDIAGTLSARQLVVASADGNSVSTPQANVDFAVGLNREDQVLAINTLNADTGFGLINVRNATVPLGKDSPAPLNLQVFVDKLDLARIEPYAAFFATFPEGLSLEGIAQSQVNVTAENGVYHLSSTNTRIQNLQVISPEKEPFKQDQVTTAFDVYIDPNQKTIDIERLQVDSPQIKIRMGQFQRTTQGDTTKFQGSLEGQWDLAAVGQVASNFLPGTLDLAGQRPVSLNFTSTYPANDPNALLANLNGQTSLGFDRAAYMGFDFGPADVNVRVADGLMRIGPFSTTVNNGKLNFTGEANLRQTPVLLRVPAPIQLVQGVQINEETAERFLKYVNPIFANAVSVSGIANFDVQQLAIPLTGGDGRAMEVTGTLRIDQLELGASNILNQILSVGGESIRGQKLTVRPTKLILQNGVVRYDDMQIDVGDNPVNFRGSVNLNGTLDLTVVLPYTLEGRTVRVGQERGAPRITVPLTGTIAKPELNLKNLIQSQFEEQILKGLEDLLKKQ